MKKSIFFIAIAIIFFACNNGSHSEHEGEILVGTDANAHDHAQESSISYTLFSDATELFVEFPVMMVNHNVEFLAHLTWSHNYKPVTNGKLTIVLSNETEKIEKTVDAPAREGIFIPIIKPAKAGKYKLYFTFSNDTVVNQFVIDDIVVYANHHDAESYIGKEEDEEAISFLKEQAWKTDFALTEAKTKMIYEVIKTTGQILPAQGDEIIVSAKHSGIVVFGTNRLIEGNTVNTGETLFTISGGELTHDNFDTKFKEAKANYEKLEADFKRAEELIKDKLISEKEYLEIQMNYENAKNVYTVITKNYVVGGQKTTAPIKGFIKAVYVSEGQYVEIGQPIASIAQNRRLIIKAEVSHKHFALLPKVFSVNFRTAYSDKIFSLENLNGRLMTYGKNVEENAFFIPVFFEIDNKGEIIPGCYVEVFLKANIEHQALVIPFSSLMETQDSYYVFVQIGGETYKKREVILGVNDGVNVQIISGLNEGDHVVSRGAYRVKLASMSGSLPAHGHTH